MRGADCTRPRPMAWMSLLGIFGAGRQGSPRVGRCGSHAAAIAKCSRSPAAERWALQEPSTDTRVLIVGNEDGRFLCR